VVERSTVNRLVVGSNPTWGVLSLQSCKSEKGKSEKGKSEKGKSEKGKSEKGKSEKGKSEICRKSLRIAVSSEYMYSLLLTKVVILRV
jgi:hypothetical protein